MPTKTFQVRFTGTAVGTEEVTTLDPHLVSLTFEHGSNLPEVEFGGEGFQVRELLKVGQVWKGSFAKLRTDAPHVVDSADNEHELELEEGDRIVDKALFLFYANTNVLVWQTNRNAGSIGKLCEYLGRICGTYVDLPWALDTHSLEEALSRDIHEVHFTYIRPQIVEEDAPQWRQAAFDLIRSVQGAVGKFVVRAGRQESLGGRIKQMLPSALQSQHTKKIRVKFTDEPANLVDLFLSPIKDHITVPMLGRYPVAARVYEELAEAYGRQIHRIPH